MNFWHNFQLIYGNRILNFEGNDNSKPEYLEQCTIELTIMPLKKFIPWTRMKKHFLKR